MRRLPALIATVLVGAGVAAGWSGAAMAQLAGGARLPTLELEHLVILLRPPAIDELTREALSRISGELAAARFRVIIFPLDVGTDPIEQVETVGRDLDPVAAFALVRGTGPSSGNVELWISDRLAQRTTIQRMRVEPANPAGGGDVSHAAAVLAVESVELIRVSMAEVWPALPRPPPADIGAVAPEEQTARGPTVGLGVAMLHDFRGVRPTFAPVATIGFGRAGGFGVSIAARGLGPAIEIPEAAGTASVRRATGWVAVSRGFRPGRVLQPTVSLGLGADYLRAEGSTMDPTTVTHVRASWSALAVAGAGLAVQVAAHLCLVIDVEGMLFVPPVVVRIAGEDVARLDRPSVLVDAGLQARF